ncbi:hypothetical protein CDAR_231131 [Caerostris darwini]|uniref:Uncharacterized protein n=1 Tax=Caerostris darwini TaxID=1538125 RepID=A0AAV4N734_9ARAC|nr:hypothetical protein CDAR_231131 [Caerostris darwini]
MISQPFWCQSDVYRADILTWNFRVNTDVLHVDFLSVLFLLLSAFVFAYVYDLGYEDILQNTNYFLCLLGRNSVHQFLRKATTTNPQLRWRGCAFKICHMGRPPKISQRPEQRQN